VDQDCLHHINLSLKSSSYSIKNPIHTLATPKQAMNTKIISQIIAKLFTEVVEISAAL